MSVGWLRRNRSIVLMWTGIIGLSTLLVFRVQAALEARTDRQEEQRAADERRQQAPPPEPEPVNQAVTEVEWRSYERGECVTWDQSAPFVSTKVVPCDEEHLVEMIQPLDVDASADAPYPTEAEWDDMFGQMCGPVARGYLDGRLDPYGTLGPGGLHPLQELWGSGVRKIWCGIQSATSADTSGGIELKPIAGRAAEIDQSWMPPVGSCLTVTSTSSRISPCSESHHLVVVGHLDLSELTERPGDIDIRIECERAFSPAGDMGNDQIAYLGFEPESWAAGTRRGPCVRGSWSEGGGGLPDLRPPTHETS